QGAPPNEALAAGAQSHGRLRIVLALSLGVLAVVAFIPCLSNDFVLWDDDQNFLENPFYRGLGWQQLRWDWTSFRIGVYQPLAWMVLGAEYLLFGLDARGYHIASLVLHALNTIVLFMLTLALLARAGVAPGPEGSRDYTLGAGLAVGLHAVHPLRT